MQHPLRTEEQAAGNCNGWQSEGQHTTVRLAAGRLHNNHLSTLSKVMWKSSVGSGMLWPNWSSEILAGNAVLMAVFVITVEKRIISPRYENHWFAGKSKTNFKNYSNSIMTFLSRTHNYVGDNSNECLDIDEIITDLPNLFKINDHKVAKINV